MKVPPTGLSQSPETRGNTVSDPLAVSRAVSLLHGDDERTVDLLTIWSTLAIHAAYTRDEILVAFGHWNFNDRPSQREGALHLQDRKHDVFFVTLQKTEDEYSPTTMYEDYLISHDQFNWQSQSNTSEQSPTGQRCIRHREIGYKPLLFVRETKNLPSGISAPYHFVGPCRCLSHSGSRPISIIWELE